MYFYLNKHRLSQIGFSYKIRGIKGSRFDSSFITQDEGEGQRQGGETGVGLHPSIQMLIDTNGIHGYLGWIGVSTFQLVMVPQYQYKCSWLLLLIINMQFNRPETKVDLTHLYYNRDKATVDSFTTLPFQQKLNALSKATQNTKHPILKLIDTDIILSFKKHIFDMLQSHIIQMKKCTIEGMKYDYSNLNTLIKIVYRLLNEDAYLADESENYEKYMDILTYSQDHSIIADVFEIFGKTSFDRAKKIVFYYILSYIKHWNNHNDRHYTLVDVLHIHPDFCFEYVQNGAMISIKRPANLTAHYPQSNHYQISQKILMEENMKIDTNEPLFHQLLCKVRLAMTNTVEKSEVVRGVLSAYKIFSFMDLMWYRTNPSSIPNIFQLPPNYVQIFKEILQLFLHPECSENNRIVVLDLLKVVITFEIRRGESDILVSLLENYILLQNFLTDMKDFIQNKKTKYIHEDNFKNTNFVLKVLKLFDNLDSGLVLDSTSEILEGYFYSPDMDEKIVEGAGSLIINGFLQENTEAEMTEFIFEKIKSEQSKNTKAYIQVLIELLSEDVRQRTTQRRDSTALARTITDSQIFPSLIKLIHPPFQAGSLAMRVTQLLTSICCQNPLQSQILYDPICHILNGFKKIENYPLDGEQLCDVVDFFHYVSLKKGKIRDKILSENIISNLMEIFIDNRFATVIAGKYLNSLINNIQRFIANIPEFGGVFFKGVLAAMERTAISTTGFTIYMDNLLLEEPVKMNETIKYEELTGKMTALFKIVSKLYKIHPIYVNHQSYRTMIKYKYQLFTFKYLNIHNPSCNREIARNSSLSLQDTVDQLINTVENIQVEVPLEFLKAQETKVGSLEHILTSNFFDMLHRSKKEPEYKYYLTQYTQISLLERISVMLSMDVPVSDEVLGACSKHMHLLPGLDIFRAKEDSFHLTKKLSKVKKNFVNIKQKVDFLRHHIKIIGEKDGPFSMAHQCLRKVLILVSQRKDFNLIRSHCKIVREDMVNFDKIQLNSSIECLYLLKLKIENLQYVLNSLNSSLSNDFPVEFASFIFFLDANPLDILAPLIKVASFYYYHPCEEDMSWSYIMRTEVMVKIMLVINNLIAFKEESNYSSQEDSQFNLEAASVNHVAYTIQKSLMGLVYLLPKQPVQTRSEIQQVMEKIVQGVLRNIKYIQDVATDNEFYLVKPKIHFATDSNKLLGKNEYAGKLRDLYLEFKEKGIEELENFAISTEEHITTLYESAFNERLKLYQKKRALNDLYHVLSTKVLRTSKQLFQDFVLDLGVKHPKQQQIHETNARKCVINASVLVESISMILGKIMNQEWFGRGELEITPHYVSEILRFITSIIVNWKEIRESPDKSQYDPYDKLIVKTMKFIRVSEKYFVMQLDKKKKQEEKEKEESLKERHKSKVNKKNQKAQKKEILPKKSKLSSKEEEQIVTQNEKKEKLSKRKKNKIKKLWEFNKQVTLFVESVILESSKTPLMKSTTFQDILSYVEMKISKKESVIELAKFNLKNFNIFEVKTHDKDKTGLLVLTLYTLIRMMPLSHHKIEVEALIKRVFFEVDPKKVTKIPFNSIADLTSNVESRDDFEKVVKKICLITENGVENQQPVSYETASENPLKYSIILKPSVDYVTIVTKHKKNKRQSHKKSINKQELNPDNEKCKTLDYIPEGNVADFVRQLLDFTIEHIIIQAINAGKQPSSESKTAFNSMIGIYALQTVLRICPTFIPFVTRYRCKRTLNNIQQKCQELTEITGGSIRLEQTDMTFVGFLVRVAAPLMFDRIQYLLNEICSDNYVLVNSHKDVVVPLGQYVRSKIIKEMSTFDVNQNPTKTISYLTLLTHLLKFREFSILALQQGVVEVLHKQIVSLEKVGYQREPYLQFFNLLSLPLTILHSFNLQLQITKFKPLEMRAKTLSFRNQLIPMTCFKGNKFNHNWPYSTAEIIQGNELQDDLHELGGHIEQFDRNSFIIESDSDSGEEEESDNSEMSIHDSQMFINNQILEEIEEQDGVSRGWTSNMGNDDIGFDDDFDDDGEDMDSQLEEIIELDEDENSDDEDLDIDDMNSDEILEELGADHDMCFSGDFDYHDDLEDSDRSSNLRDVHTILVGMIGMESQNGDLSPFYAKLMAKIRDLLHNEKNVLGSSIPAESPGGKLLKVARALFEFVSENSSNMEEMPKFKEGETLNPMFHRRLLHDDSQNVSLNRRRNGEIYGMMDSNPNFVMRIGESGLLFTENNGGRNQMGMLRAPRIERIDNGDQSTQQIRLLLHSDLEEMDVEEGERPQQQPNQQQRLVEELEEEPEEQHPQPNAQARSQEDVVRMTRALLAEYNNRLNNREDLESDMIEGEEFNDMDIEEFPELEEDSGVLGREGAEVLENLTDDRIKQLLRQNQFDEDYFYSLPREGREEILQNMLGMVEYEVNNPVEENPIVEAVQEEGVEVVPENNEERMEEELPQLPQTGRRKISMQYHKKIEKDPKQLIIKEKKQNKIYICQNDFWETILNIIYFDLYDFGSCFPYVMLKNLCTNPINQNKFLSCLLILLKHPNLKALKQEHNEPPTKFPKSVLLQRNNEIITDYEREGYHQVCEKVLYILSFLSKSNPSGMLLSKHNKVDFLPEWYYVEQLPYYKHLIHLIKTPHFKNNKLLGELTDILFNIVNHHSMRYIHALEQKQAVEFQMKLEKEDIELLCFLLYGEYSETKSDEVIKNIVLLLCVNDSNLKMFIDTFEEVVDSLSKKSMQLLRNEINQQYTNEDKLHNILRIVASMFQDQYQAKIEKKNNEKNKIKEEVLREFKRVLECPALIELFKLCSGLSVNYPKKIHHLERIEVILSSFFVVYNIVTAEEEEQQKTNEISKMEELNSTKKVSISSPLFGIEVERALGEVFNILKTNAKPMVNHLLKEVLNSVKKTHRSKENASIFTEPIIKILSKNSTLIDYENKRSMFKTELKNLRKNQQAEEININVVRENVLLSSMNQIMPMTAAQLMHKFHITFDGEEGEDVGGLTREWFMLLSKEIFNPHYALFTPSSTGSTYQPRPDSYVNSNHLFFFKFIGRMVGKALHDGYLLDAYFTPAFYKHILGKPLSLNDLQEQDYEFYKNLDWVLKNDITDLDLTFCYQEQYFGKIQVKDLIPNGRNVQVTEENKVDYVQRRSYARMATAVQKQIESFLMGFHELIPHKLVSIFEHKELELMISGLPTIDILDLKDNTQLVNYQKTDNIIVWLFEVLESFDNNLRASFLQFVTGTSRVPSEGFKALRGMSGPQKFTIQKDFGVDKLPRAHTCFNQLDLPTYPTKEILIEKLTLAITEGREGFGFI